MHVVLIQDKTATELDVKILLHGLQSYTGYHRATFNIHVYDLYLCAFLITISKLRLPC